MSKSFTPPPGWGQPPADPVPKQSMPTGAKVALGILGGLVLIGGCNAIITGGKGVDAKPAAASKPAALPAAKPSPSSSSAAPSASLAPAASTAAQPSSPAPVAADPSCGPNLDIIVRYVVPGLEPSAQVLGSYKIATCQPTFETLKETSPTEAGYCTEAAWASDNPGYDADATPAAPLRKVQVAFGPACY